MKVSDYVAEFLHAQSVPQVFELVGGMITHLIDSIDRHGSTRLVSMHHEQSAAFAADAVGRVTGVPGVAMATSGPGATNLITGIGSCYFDASPAVFLTGQVNRHELRGTRPIRQLGFQETDIVAVAAPLTKSAYCVCDPADIPRRLAEAFVLAQSGRPGPVLLDIPMDVQRAQIDAPAPVLARPLVPSSIDQNLIDQITAALRAAKRPLILAGGGIRAARALSLFRDYIDQVRIPVVHSLMAVDALPYSHPMRVGMIGSYGNRWANLAIGGADVLLVLGSRLDIRQTGALAQAFRGNRQLFHVDCDPGEINNRVLGCEAVVGDLRSFLRQIAQSPVTRCDDWLAEINRLRMHWPDTAELRNCSGINPNTFMHALSHYAGDAAAFIADVGQHQMWAAQSLELSSNQQFLTSGGMGAMGFALPAAIGATFALGGSPIVAICGDGGFQLNLQELQTIVRNKLPVKIVVLNNKCHGMVRQFQESYFDQRYPSTYRGYSSPDFVAVARAYGLAAEAVTHHAALDTALQGLWHEPHTPFLLEVSIDTLTNVYPKIAFGFPVTEMEPLTQPLDMEST